MKKNFPVTNTEKTFDSFKTLTSSTDLTGKITYANDDFCDIAGFSLAELLNKSHNIVRHPDMPQAAFADLWQTIQNGNSWMGIVKNRCKNGDYYWVDAFVTPMTEENKVTGYESTRVKPEDEIKARAERVYKELARGGKIPSDNTRCNFKGKLFGSFSIIVFIAFGILVSFGDIPYTKAAIVISIALVATHLLIRSLCKPLDLAAKEAAALVDNPSMQFIYTGRTDEIGQLSLTIKLLRAKVRTVLRRLEQATGDLLSHAQNAAESSGLTNDAMVKQQSQIEEVASAMTQMTTSINEVARNASFAAESAQNADDNAKNILLNVQSSIRNVDSISERVCGAQEAINNLAADSENIGSVLEVIREIADQTNLLALNAAIEAARAGEQGRGFAVVADEVRLLASRTQDSTEEIRKIIQGLQLKVNNAVQQMVSVRDQSDDTIDQVKTAIESVTNITQAVGSIRDMNTQIATAAEQQHVVSENIAGNIEKINQISDQTVCSAQKTSNISSEMTILNQKLLNMVEQFQENT